MATQRITTDFEEAIKAANKVSDNLDALCETLSSNPITPEISEQTIKKISKELLELQIRKQALVDSTKKNNINQNNEAAQLLLTKTMNRLASTSRKIIQLNILSNPNKDEYLQWYSEFREIITHSIKELKLRTVSTTTSKKSRKQGNQQKQNEKTDQLLEAINFNLSKLDGIKTIMESKNSILIPVDKLTELKSKLKAIFSSDSQEELINDDSIKQLYITIEGIYESELNGSASSDSQPSDEQSAINASEQVKYNSKPLDPAVVEQTEKMIQSQIARKQGNSYLLRMLESSYSNQVQLSDMYPTDLTKLPEKKSSLFPKHKMLDENVFSKLDNQALFFTFYFQKNTYEQYQAARELRKKNWRYHTKYMTWFQRFEEPKTVKDDFEQGTYVIFDHEKGWMQRKKTDFKFKYAYLEDELN